MTIDFYHLLISAPCRSVLMTAKAVGVELNLITLDLMSGEHLKPEFLKINPQHTIPTMVDDGFVLWESRAILVYLAEKFDKNGSLYPKCPKHRAIINQRLYFDMGVLYQRFGEYYYAQIFKKEPGDPEKLKKMIEGVEFFDKFLENSTYAAGNKITVADLSMGATMSTYEAVGFDLSKYPNVEKWYAKCKETLPGWNINEEGVEQFKAFLNK